jgi:phosphodiesterase/alkaline phosphatase D-like protein
MTTWQQLYDAASDETTYLNVSTGEKLSEIQFKELADTQKTEIIHHTVAMEAATKASMSNNATTTTTTNNDQSSNTTTSSPSILDKIKHRDASTSSPNSKHISTSKHVLEIIQNKAENVGETIEHKITNIGTQFQNVGTNIDNVQDKVTDAVHKAQENVVKTATWYWYAPWMERLETWLVIFSTAFAAVAIACVQQMLNIAPYSQMAVAYAFFSIGYVVLSTISVSLWVYLYRERKRRDGDKWFAEFTVRSKKFWLYVAGLVAFLICTIVMVSFIFIETFHPTYATMTFARLGGVTQTQASFFVRDPITSGPVYVEFRRQDVDILYNSTERHWLNSSYDYATWFYVSNLDVNTTYEWHVIGSTSSSNYTFNTLPAVGTPVKFSFYFGSCFTPFFPSLEDAPGYGYVSSQKPDLLIQLGDFIYKDVPYDEDDDLRTYRDMYRQSFRNHYTLDTFRTTPNYHMWDDHEIINDYVPQDLNEPRYQNGIMKSWTLFLGNGNPRTKPFPHHYFWFDYGDTSFFILDTRSNRSYVASNKAIPQDDPNSWIISHEQEQDLKDWLLTKQQSSVKFKFVFSPIGFPQDFVGHITDSWGGFLTQRNRIFDFIRKNNITGTTFYTGDYHAAYVIELQRNGSQLYEFSASPVSAFDFSLGNYAPYSSDMWKEINIRSERVLFTDIGHPGPVELMGIVDVDTTVNPPNIVNKIFHSNRLVYSLKLTVDDLQPK